MWGRLLEWTFTRFGLVVPSTEGNLDSMLVTGRAGVYKGGFCMSWSIRAATLAITTLVASALPVLGAVSAQATPGATVSPDVGVTVADKTPLDVPVTIRTFADKCLDVRGASTADSTPIIQYRCHGGANQRFTIRYVGSGRYEIRTFANKCLDVRGASTADSTPIIQYRCHGGANQRFTIRYVGSGRYEIRTFANKCLDVRGASTADSTPIIQYRCHGGANQRFEIR